MVLVCLFPHDMVTAAGQQPSEASLRVCFMQNKRSLCGEQIVA